MILLSSPAHKALRAAALEALGGSPAQWSRLLGQATNKSADPCLALLDGAPTDLANLVDEWLERADSRSSEVTSPLASPTSEDMTLYYLWEYLRNQVQAGLRAARLLGSVPLTGGILMYVGGLSRCIVLDYAFRGDVPELRPVALIRDPRASFDFWEALANAAPAARNYIKRTLGTGHKMIWHRGCLVHVDRRHDTDVFGPSIDTLLLAEVMHQAFFEHMGNQPGRIMEIGVGSGLLSASVLRASPSSALVGIDSNPAAVICTYRNLSTALHGPPGARVHLITGLFEPASFAHPVDLAICNPPYIPVPSTVDYGRLPFAAAVGGTTLLAEVLRSLPDVLTPDGQLALIISELCMQEVRDALPAGYALEPALGGWQGFPVIFDVDAVLESPQWLEFLQNQRGLRLSDGFFFHNLHPVWVRRCVQ